MGRLGWGSYVGLTGAVALLAVGCGSEQFAPPPGLRTATTSESAEPAKTVFLVIPGPPDYDLQTYSLSAEREAGNRQAIYRLMGSGPGEPPSKQAEIIRKAAGDGADALVVLANDDPATAEALAEVSGKGIPIILYGKALVAKPGKTPYILVAPEPFDTTAKLAVEAAQADARKYGRPADGEAVILVSSKSDMFSADRVTALKAAAEAAGCRKVEVISFEGKPEDELKGMIEKMKARPDLTIMLGEGDEAMELAIRTRLGLKGVPLTFVGGYGGTHGVFTSVSFSRESAFIEFRPDNLARLAVRTALAKASGEEVAPVVTLASKFNRGEGTAEFEVPRLEPTNPPAPEKKAMAVPPLGK